MTEAKVKPRTVALQTRGEKRSSAEHEVTARVLATSGELHKGGHVGQKRLTIEELKLENDELRKENKLLKARLHSKSTTGASNLLTAYDSNDDEDDYIGAELSRRNLFGYGFCHQRRNEHGVSSIKRGTRTDVGVSSG